MATLNGDIGGGLINEEQANRFMRILINSNPLFDLTKMQAPISLASLANGEVRESAKINLVATRLKPFEVTSVEFKIKRFIKVRNIRCL